MEMGSYLNKLNSSQNYPDIMTLLTRFPIKEDLTGMSAVHRSVVLKASFDFCEAI